MNEHASFIADIRARVNDFMANVRKVTAEAQKLPNEITIDVEADIEAVTAQLERMKSEMRSIPNTIKSKMDFDLGKARIELASIEASIRSLDGKSIDVNVDADVAKAKADINSIKRELTIMSIKSKAIKIAVDAQNAIKEMGTLRAAMLALAPAIIPIIASLIPAIMALGNAIAVVGGGVIGLAGAFGIAGAGVMAFGAMAMTAYKMLQDGTIQATKETFKFQKSLNSLKTTWQNVIKANQAEIFNTMTNGLNAAKTALQKMTPFLSGVAQGMERISTSMVKWTKSSPVAEKFFKMINTTGVSIFNDIADAAGKFGDGVINIFTQFGPLFKFMSNGLKNMGSDFQKWANKVSTQQGIKDFINYTKQNLPIIGEIFGNTFKGIFNLFKAFGTNSQNIFKSLQDMTKKFADWSAEVGKSQGFKDFIKYVEEQGPKIAKTIGNIANALVQFGIAMAPIGGAVLDVVSGFAEWVGGFAKAHPNIMRVVGAVFAFGGAALKIGKPIFDIGKKIFDLNKKFGLVGRAIQILSPLFGMLSGPVGIAIAIIGALAGAFYLAYTKIEWFRDGVNNIAKAIAIGFTQMVLGIKAVWDNLPIIIETAWTLIKTAVQTGIDFVKNLFMTFGEFIKTVFMGAWNGLATVVTTVWTTISNAVMTGIEFVKNLFMGFGEAIKTIFLNAWNGLVLTVQTVWTTIGTVIGTAIETIKTVVMTGWGMLRDTVVTIMQTIWTAITTAWTQITTTIGTAIQGAVTAVVNGFTQMLQTASQIMQGIWDAVVNAWNQITSSIGTAIQGAVTAVSNGFNQMLQVAGQVMQGIWSAIQNAWSQITNTISQSISQAVQAVSQGFSQMIQAVSQFASQLVSNIGQAMSQFVQRVMQGGQEALNAIKTACSNMVSAVSGFVGQMMSAGADLVNGFVNGIKSKIGDAVSAASSMAKAAASAVSDFLIIGSPSKLLKQIGQWMTQGFALGIEKDIPKVATAVDRMLRPVRKGLAKLKTANYSDAKKGASSVYSLMINNMNEATKKIEEIADKRKSLMEKIKKAQKEYIQAKTVKGKVSKSNEIAKLQRQFAQMTKQAKKMYKVRKVNRDLKYEIRPMLIYMARLAKKREQIAAKLDKAKDKLQAAIDKRTDFRNMIRDDLRGYASITNTGRRTSQGMVKMMTKRLAEIKKYQALIGSLKKRGLNKTTLQEILDAGIEQGSVIAKGLFAGGQQAIKQVNSLQSQINKASASMATSNANHFYQAGVDAAKGVVKGLQAQDKALKSIAEKLANTISATIKKRLKIHSPSRVMMNLMAYVGSGLVNGLKAAKSVVANASAKLSDAIERNVKPDIALAPFDLSGGMGDMKRTVAQSLDANIENGVEIPKQNITIVVRSEHDLVGLTHAIDQVKGADAALSYVG